MNRLYIIEGRFMGEAPCSPVPVHGELQRPYSLLFWCTQCGETYARLPVVREGGAQSKWSAYAACCRKCPSPSAYVVPGSIWFAWDEGTFPLAAYPDAALAWEVARRFDHFERTGAEGWGW